MEEKEEERRLSQTDLLRSSASSCMSNADAVSILLLLPFPLYLHLYICSHIFALCVCKYASMHLDMFRYIDMWLRKDIYESIFILMRSVTEKWNVICLSHVICLSETLREICNIFV